MLYLNEFIKFTGVEITCYMSTGDFTNKILYCWLEGIYITFIHLHKHKCCIYKFTFNITKSIIRLQIAGFLLRQSSIERQFALN